MRNQEDLQSLRLAEEAADVDSPDVARRLEQWRELLNDEQAENGGEPPPERSQPEG